MANRKTNGKTSALDHVNLQLEAVLGSASMTVDELRRLKSGKTVALEGHINQQLTLKLNGAVIASGELVVIDDHFAVKVTEIHE